MAMALNPWTCASILLAGLAGQAAALDLRGGGGVAVVQPFGEEALDGMSPLQLVADTNVTGGAEGDDLATVHNRTDLLQTDLPFWHGAVRGFGAQRGQTNVLKADYPLWEVLHNHSDTHWQRPIGRRLRRPHARSSHKANVMRGIVDCLKKLFYGDSAVTDDDTTMKDVKLELQKVSSKKETDEIMTDIKNSDTKAALNDLAKVLPDIKIPELPVGSTDRLFAMATLKRNKVDKVDAKEYKHILELFREGKTNEANRATVVALAKAKGSHVVPKSPESSNTLPTEKAKSSVITVATLNVGGDGPQPEYLGSAWEEVYGDVEVAVGAKILLAHRLDSKGECVPMKADDKFHSRYFAQYTAFCKSTEIKDWARKPVLDTLEEFVLPAEVKSQTSSPIGAGATWADFAHYLMLEKENQMVKAEKLGSLERACKKRRAFPFFGENFVVTYKDFKAEKPGFFEEYKGSLDKETCKDFIEGNQFLPLYLFDTFVLREFKTFLKSGEPKELELLSPSRVTATKQKIVSLLAPRNADVDVHVLFLQEANDVLDREGQLAGVTTQPGGHHELLTAKKEFDTAVLTREAIKKQVVSAAWGLFRVGELKRLMKAGETSFLEPPGDKRLKDKGMDPADLTTVATTVIDGHKVLLVSQHPNSNGRPCVLYATLAKRFFEKHKGDLGLELMLVGMDANVMAASDKTFEKKPGTMKKDDPADNGFDWGQFKQRVLELGYKVVNAKDGPKSIDTVYKIRTFLQSQFAKAAKVDKTTKDIILAYPPEKVTDFQAEVKNDIREGDLAYNDAKDQKYPTDTWVLDHFATRARITIDWTA